MSSKSLIVVPLSLVVAVLSGCARVYGEDGQVLRADTRAACRHAGHVCRERAAVHSSW